MLTNQHAFSEYLTLWNQFQYGHRERDVFLKELQERYPCDAKAFRKHYWSIPEATLVYYGLNPSEIFSTLDQYAFSQLLHSIDREEIRDLLENHLGYPVCPAHDAVLTNKFVSFLQEKKVPIPEHLLSLSPVPNTTSVEKAEDLSEQIENNENEENKKSRPRVFDPLVLRKEAIINKAKILWLNERRQGKTEYTKPSILIKKKEMIQLAIELNIELCLSPLGIKNDSDELDAFHSVKDNPKELRNYFNDFKERPESLIDVDWIRDFHPKG
jgi:uncharacterized protein YdiU (UPF0061 family)